MMKKKALILGGYGFLGHHLIHALEGLYEVYVAIKSTTTPPKSITNKKFNVLKVDSPLFYSNLSELKFDFIINAAVNYGKNSSQKQVWESNVDFPLDVLNSTIHSDLVFIHFDSFYSKYPEYKNLPYYKSSKNDLNRKLKEMDSIKTITLQLEHLYGPNDNETKFISRLIEMLIKQEKEIPLSEGVQKRDFIFIEDLIQLILIILVNHNLIPNGFHLFEVGLGYSISLKSFIYELKEQLNSSSFLDFGSVTTAKDEIMDSYASISIVQNIFSWQPKIDYKEGINRTIKGFLKNE